MKQRIALALVLIATAAAVTFHALKIRRTQEPLDKVAQNLEGLNRLLSNDHALSLRLAQGVPEEYFLYARFALVPRHVGRIRSNDAADTLLLIKQRQQNDSVSLHARVIWSSNDDDFDYLLLTTR